MKASVLITAFKRPHLLNFSLLSLSKFNNKFKDIEFIILNDGVEDNTREICDKYSKLLNIKYVFTGQRNTPNHIWRCPGFAYNCGSKMANGDILILSCAEIIHFDDNITKMVDDLSGDQKLMCITTVSKDDRTGEYLKHVQTCPDNLFNDRLFNDSGDLNSKIPFFMGVSKKIYYDIGGYDEDMTGVAYDDNDLIERMLAFGCRYNRVQGRILHLFHKRIFRDPAFVERVAFNKRIYEERRGIIVRNKGREWGLND